ncbi:MAG: glycosyltransferase [Symploca sp. SIO3C6]|uniref:Glycosyltransferase n=1 Tax=Symploca sp. SIO1C4 TaxID=2607765 RepID=A0A6B3N6R5_9CYAN|nr:glycosyltransferase [Symploca sp. SIO3C6]NER26495.1 glycosyltransferase [Symploca sp. SIO1C4]
MKILHVITDLFTGGAEIMLYKLLSCTDRDRFEPVVISLIDRGTLGDRIEALGIPVHTIGMKAGKPTPASVWRLVSIARQLKPDLIQGWMYHGNLAAQLTGTFLPQSIPVLWNVRHSLYTLKYEKKITAAVIKFCASISFLPTKIIYNSQTGAEQHEQNGYSNRKTIVIPNGFDTELFAPSTEYSTSFRQELGIPQNTVLIGLISRFHPMKDHTNFLNAAALLKKQNPGLNVKFVMAGKDVDWDNQNLYQLAKELGLVDSMYILGERHDMPRITAALDIASSSSYSESFPNIIGEAMLCSVPCVVTDIGDSAWIVGNTGLVVPPRNPEALCAGWLKLIDMGIEARRKIGVRARQRIEQLFSIESIVQKYEQLYQEIIYE